MSSIRSVVIAIPVLDEERVLAASVRKLTSFLRERMSGCEAVVVVADNGSTDHTPEIGKALAAADPTVAYMRVSRRGKGLAIRTVWESFDADAYAFMDADLSTDLSAFPKLIAAFEAGADIAVGSRFLPGSRVERSRLRRLVSCGYRWWLKRVLDVRFSDAPCGFKAVTKRVVTDLVPSVRDDAWFFDSELMIRAERGGYRIREIPVDWKDTRDAGRASKVSIARLAFEYMRRTLRLRRELL